MTLRKLALLASVAATLTTLAAPALAGPPHCPPGHARKGWCSPNDLRYLPPGIARPVTDWRRLDLPAPGPGRSYRIVDDRVILVVDATLRIIEAIGAVERLARSR